MEQTELIARRYCELMGLDPDEQVAHEADPDPDGFVPAVLLYSPRWMRVARQVPSQLAWFKVLSSMHSV